MLKAYKNSLKYSHWVPVSYQVVGTIQGKFLNLIYRALADFLFIYPMKGNKKTFDEHKDELGFASKPKVFKVKKTDA